MPYHVNTPPLQNATIDSNLPITQTADAIEEVMFRSLAGDAAC